MFKIGQKVVCVNDNLETFKVAGFDYTGDLNGLKKGEVYTIRGVKFFDRPSIAAYGVHIEEITRPFDLNYCEEAPFHVRCFVPVQDKGMEILRSILVEQKENAW